MLHWEMEGLFFLASALVCVWGSKVEREGLTLLSVGCGALELDRVNLAAELGQGGFAAAESVSWRCIWWLFLNLNEIHRSF